MRGNQFRCFSFRDVLPMFPIGEVDIPISSFVCMGCPGRWKEGYPGRFIWPLWCDFNQSAVMMHDAVVARFGTKYPITYLQLI